MSPSGAGLTRLVTFSSQLGNQKLTQKLAFLVSPFFFHCTFRKIQFFDQENQSFLEKKLFATKKTEIRVKKVTILMKKKTITKKFWAKNFFIVSTVSAQILNCLSWKIQFLLSNLYTVLSGFKNHRSDFSSIIQCWKQHQFIEKWLFWPFDF